jgi:serine/threonine-protein kinase
MGEVYRADDLLLRQPVAMKFLPRAATSNESAVSRFRNEVRVAREVSHPNVCRVYDIGEAEGLTFLTMEYVDGEDLERLLRRIGKLPGEKALDVARKLCAGLAAAHEKGVIHRDLKPANVMLDSKGHVRITDFGLAVVAKHVHDVESGTPAYMAPEQRAGREVTVASDIYSLGVVLYELFTGARPSPENNTADLDPAVERTITRCLHMDPAMRPGSALAVSASLPGGDPIATALAAGEVPSPDAVANAGAVEGLRVPVAIACLVAVIVGLAAFALFRQRRDIVNHIPMENSPQVLAAKARDIVRSLGYTERPVDTAFGWEYDADYLRYLMAEKDDDARNARIKTNRPPPLFFWYRQSPRYLYHPSGNFITRTQPGNFDPGMLGVVLDSEGRLVELDAQIGGGSHPGLATPAADWKPLFAAAGLDASRFTRTEPLLVPPTHSDTRAAWVGSWGELPGRQVRIEAAAYDGRPVFFRIVGPWTSAARTEPLVRGGFAFPALLLFLVLIPAVAGVLAWKNNRKGLGDRRGAFRLAAFTFVCAFVRSTAGQHHVPAMAEAGLLFFATRDALTVAAIIWALYMAFEPYVRKQSPRTLISWTRLLNGRLRDPLVGADLLAGCVLGTVALCVVRPLVSPFNASIATQVMSTPGGWFSAWCLSCIFAVGAALSSLFLLTLFLLLVRVRWLAALLFIGATSLVPTLPGAAITTVVVVSFIWYALTQFGVLTASALLYVVNLSEVFPSPLSRSAWYADSALLAVLSIVILAVYAFHTTVAGRPLWRNNVQRR